MSKDIMSMTYGELAEVFSGRGLPGFRAKQVYQWLHCRLAASYDEMTDLPKALREQLAKERQRETRREERAARAAAETAQEQPTAPEAPAADSAQTDETN